MMDLTHIYFSGSTVSKSVGMGGYASSFRTQRSRRPLHDAAELAEPDPFIRWALQTSGIAAGAYQAKPLHRRLAACLRFLRVEDTNKAHALLHMKPELLPEALNTLLIGVTNFFRDKHVFDSLRKQVLPQMLVERTGLRVCSVGVSDGQELYSMAMLLAEAGVLGSSKLLGIDCRTSAIKRAKAGIYDAAELSDIPEGWRQQYFRPTAGGYAVCAELRTRMRWEVGDLFSLGGGRMWDIILFRNVAIYFKPSAAADAWQTLVEQLAAGGCLITGTAEKPLCSQSLRRLSPCIYVKNGN